MVIFHFSLAKYYFVLNPEILIMFPYLYLFWYELPVQGLWIVIATLIFIWAVARYSKKFNLKFSYFFNFLGFFIIVSYVLGRYFYNALEYHLFLPTDLWNLIFPYDFKFSFIWVSFWFLVVLFLFLWNLKYTQEKKKWFDAFFYSLSISLVVLGPFLLFGDVFFGKLTTSSLSVHALTTNTQIPYPTQNFWPVGIFVSFLGLIMYLLGKLLHFIFKKPGLTVYLLPLYFLGFAWIFNFQYYPKHFLFWIDVKILYCYLGAVIFTILFIWVLDYRRW